MPDTRPLTPDAPSGLAMTQTQLARALGVSDRTIRNWERAGKLTGNRPNNGVKLYPLEDARRLIRGAH